MKLTDQEQVVLKAIGHGVAEVSQVLRAVGYLKAATKKILIGLLDKGVVTLYRHDYPASLTPEQRKLMVRHKGNYYSAVSVREKNPVGKSKGKTALRKTGKALKGLAKGALGAASQILGAGAEALNPHGMSEKAWKAEENKYRKSIAAYRAKGWTYQQIKDRLWLTYGLTLSKLESDHAVFVDPFRRGGGFTLDLNAPKRGRKTNPKRKTAKKTTRQRRNSDHKDSDHPIEVTKHWRSGPPGYLTPWQRAHHAGQHDLFAHGIKPAKKRNAGFQWHGRPQRVRFISGEYKGRTGVVQSVIQKRYTKEPTVYRIQVDGFPKPGGWSGKVTAEPHQLEAIRENSSTRSKGKKRNASTSVNRRTKKASGAGASRKVNHRSRVRSVAKTRKASAKRTSSKPLKKSSSVKGRRRNTQRIVNNAKIVNKRANPSAESIRREFAGSINGERDLFFPRGTPSGKLAKLGKLVSITTKAGTIKPVHGTAWLCADTKGKLHIGSTSNAPLINGPARNFGHVTKLEYESSKPHLGYKGPIIWFHKAGEENGIRPTLRADGKGGLVFRGGDYRLTERGIEN